MIDRDQFVTYITVERGYTLEDLDEALVLDLLIDCVSISHRLLLPDTWTQEMVVEKLRSVFVGDPLIESMVTTLMGHIEDVARARV